MLLQWRVTGGLGYHGAHAVKPVVRVHSPESVCATTLLQHSMGRSVRAQTPKHKCARRDLVLVRTPVFYFPFKFDSYSFKVTEPFLLLFPPVDGKWSSWVSWGACSVSCGGGTRQRRRLCANPAPQHGGRHCEGNDVHIDFCNSDPCPSESYSLLYSLVKLYKFRILTIICPLCHYMYISVYLFL